MKSRRSRRRRGGFTLLEVLLVLAILVIMGSTVGYYIFGMQKKGYVRTTQTQLGMLEDTINLYAMDMGSPPQSLSGLRMRPDGAQNAHKWDGPYAEKDIPADPWGNQYQYEIGQDGTFNVWSMGPDSASGSEDDVLPP